MELQHKKFLSNFIFVWKIFGEMDLYRVTLSSQWWSRANVKFLNITCHVTFHSIRFFSKQTILFQKISFTELPTWSFVSTYIITFLTYSHDHDKNATMTVKQSSWTHQMRTFKLRDNGKIHFFVLSTLYQNRFELLFWTFQTIYACPGH